MLGGMQMRRVSEHIDYHARRIAQRTRDKAQKLGKRPVALSLVVITAVLISSGSYLYMHEAAAVREQNISQPVACAQLHFPPNSARCERALTDAYGGLHGLDRDPICNRTQDRSRFGSAVALCAEYDDALAAQIYNATLQDRGIAPWEPETPIVTGGTIHVRTLDQVSSMNIVCAGALLDSNWSSNGTSGAISFAPLNASCTLIAKTGAGSISSAEFPVRTGQAD
jgi:hypothetical protein